MRIIQTFWSGGGNPQEKSFGWPLPEYNLMSWTLSCLSLRKFYDDVELYTDQEGYNLLIGKLHLPYSHVHVIYDNNLCRPKYWAYAKIMTYSVQEEPFIHVDGDVYISEPFPENALQAPLVVQNREIGTIYYREMVNEVLRMPGITLSEELKESISTDSVSSYNMGVFGGTDLNFIHAYSEKASTFVRCTTGCGENAIISQGSMVVNVSPFTLTLSWEDGIANVGDNSAPLYITNVRAETGNINIIINIEFMEAVGVAAYEVKITIRYYKNYGTLGDFFESTATIKLN